MRAVGSNASYTKLPPMHVNRATPQGLRLDANSGHVQYVGEYSEPSSSSSGSDGDDDGSTAQGHRGSVSLQALLQQQGGTRRRRRQRRGDPVTASGGGVGSDGQHGFGLKFTATSFLRPKQLLAEVRYAPGALTHAVMLGFYEEGILFLFGGNENGTKPTNHTWIYAIAERRWLLLNPLELVSDKVTALRRSRGMTGERVPPPRAGHSCSSIRDVREVRQIDPQSLQLVPLPPSQTTTTTASIATYEPSVLLFGGADLSRGVYFHDLWLFDVEALAWRELKPGGKPPKPRWHHSAAVLERRLYIYGGESSEFHILGDLHMYDHDQGMWRTLRTVDPSPPSRMLHAVAVVGDSMVTVGGIGLDTHNGSILEAARGLVNNSRVRTKSLRRFSQPNLQEQSTKDESGTREELSDVWVLCMRTLVWREVAQQNKASSPFAVREDARVVGTGSAPSPVCTRGSDTGPQLPPTLHPLQLRSLEGHSATPFDHRVLVMGGRLSGKTNRNLFLLDLRTEQWLYLGEQPTGKGEHEIPPARYCHAVCTVVERSSHNAMRGAAPLSVLEGIASTSQQQQQPLSLTSVGSMANFEVTRATTSATLKQGGTTVVDSAPSANMVSYVDLMLRQLASQISFTGVLSMYDSRPIMTRTVCGFMFGGAGNGKQHSDLWRMELTSTTPTPSATYDHLFGSAVDKLLSGASRTEFGGPMIRKPPLLLPLTQHQQQLLDATTAEAGTEMDDLSDEQWAALGNYLRGTPAAGGGGSGSAGSTGGSYSAGSKSIAPKATLTSGSIVGLLAATNAPTTAANNTVNSALASPSAGTKKTSKPSK